MKLTIVVPDNAGFEFEDGAPATKLVQTLIRVPVELRNEIEVLSIAEDRSISNLVVRLIRAGLAQLYPNRKGSGAAT